MLTRAKKRGHNKRIWLLFSSIGLLFLFLTIFCAIFEINISWTHDDEDDGTKSKTKRSKMNISFPYQMLLFFLHGLPTTTATKINLFWLCSWKYHSRMKDAWQYWKILLFFFVVFVLWRYVFHWYTLVHLSFHQVPSVCKSRWIVFKAFNQTDFG